MIITPIQDTVIVEPDTRTTHTDTGLVIPENAYEIILTGTVQSVGPGRARKVGGPVIPVDLRPGDRVLYERHMGTEVKSHGKKVLLLREKHVQGVVGTDTLVEIPRPPAPPQESFGGNTGASDYDV